MANPEQVARLKEGGEAWNEWRSGILDYLSRVSPLVQGGSHHQITSHQTWTPAVQQTVQEIASETQQKSSQLALSPVDLQKLKEALAHLDQKNQPSPGIVKQGLEAVKGILGKAAVTAVSTEATKWLPVVIEKIEAVLRTT